MSMMGYNPRAYVPGGSTLPVARAIQAKGMLRRRPPVVRKPIIGGPRRIIPGAAPNADPLMTRANNTVFGMVNPLIQRLAASRAQAEAGARAQYAAHTGALEQGLMGTAAPISASYNQAIGSSAAVNEAVADRLKGEGGTAVGGLAAQLAQIQANPATQNALAQTYSGAEGAGFAHGAADIQHLLGRRAEAQAYTGKLPQIARLQGNQDLQQALSEMRGEFGERETGLLTDAQDKQFALYNQFRDEGREDANNQLGLKQANAELRSKERLALLALRDSASTRAEKRAYDIQIRNWDRKNQVADDQADYAREYQLAQMKYENSTKTAEDKLAWDAEKQRINNNRIVSENAKNRAASAAKPANKNKNDTWQTPGSAKQQRVINNIRYSIINPDTGRIRDAFVNSSTPDKAISKKIWTAIRLQVGNTTSKEAKELYRNIFLSLEGAPSARGPYQLPSFVRR